MTIHFFPITWILSRFSYYRIGDLFYYSNKGSVYIYSIEDIRYFLWFRPFDITIELKCKTIYSNCNNWGVDGWNPTYVRNYMRKYTKKITSEEFEYLKAELL